jgi:hypothetical protein
MFEPRRRTPVPHLGVALGFVMLVGGCKSTPSVEGIVKKNREEMSAFITKTRSVSAELGTLPKASGRGFELPPGKTLHGGPSVVFIVPEEDFPRLQVTPLADRNGETRWQDTKEVGPTCEFDLSRMVDAVRAQPSNPPNTTPSDVAILQRALEESRTVGFLAVVHTDSSKSATVSASTFTGADWKGHVALWDRTSNRWLGAVNVTMRDDRTRAKVGGTSHSHELNFLFNEHVNAAIRKALDTGADVNGYYGDSKSFP